MSQSAAVSHPGHGGAAAASGSAWRPVDRSRALAFLADFHRENPVDDPAARVAEVLGEIDRTGTYRHTHGELEWGARAAWRNAPRCIGRLYWNSLQVRDRRRATTPDEIALECVEHLREAWRGGRIRPTITVFPADAPDGPVARIWNDQLIRYAGYRDGRGGWWGDGQYLEFTDLVRSMGWQGEGTAFDPLPLLVETRAETGLFELPDDVLVEVPLTHPEFAWFKELQLRWHAVPAISNMRLEIGGVSYSAAPFNGWYMETEIGARNLVDAHRYNLLPAVGERMGLDTSSERTLWRDRALIELNRAILHSFDRYKVAITDHHTESQRFLRHLAKEEEAGRVCPADWSWIVPPVSGALTPVYHRYYDEAELAPAYRHDEGALLRGQGRWPAPGSPGATGIAAGPESLPEGFPRWDAAPESGCPVQHDRAGG